MRSRRSPKASHTFDLENIDGNVSTGTGIEAVVGGMMVSEGGGTTGGIGTTGITGGMTVFGTDKRIGGFNNFGEVRSGADSNNPDIECNWCERLTSPDSSLLVIFLIDSMGFWSIQPICTANWKNKRRPESRLLIVAGGVFAPDRDEI
jgi:hypothetical protein